MLTIKEKYMLEKREILDLELFEGAGVKHDQIALISAATDAIVACNDWAERQKVAVASLLASCVTIDSDILGGDVDFDDSAWQDTVSRLVAAGVVDASAYYEEIDSSCLFDEDSDPTTISRTKLESILSSAEEYKRQQSIVPEGDDESEDYSDDFLELLADSRGDDIVESRDYTSGDEESNGEDDLDDDQQNDVVIIDGVEF